MIAKAVFGPPGTGKTHFLIDYINEHTKDTIVCVSFTRAAANELLQRLVVKCHCSTLHALAYAELELNQNRIVTPGKLVEFAKLINIPIGDKTNYDDPLSVGDEYLSTISYARHKDIPFSEAYDIKGYLGNFSEFEMFRLAYHNWKRERGYIDFDDMICTAQGKIGPCDILIIDEAQDFSDCQWNYIHRIIKETSPKEVVIAGDDDQAIFTWSGANPQGMANFMERFGAEAIVLNKSWRIPASVHTIAEKLVARIPDRMPKQYTPREEKGEVKHTSRFNAFDIRPDQSRKTAILYRNHILSKNICEDLIHAGIPFTSSSGMPAPLDCKWSKAVITFSRLQEGLSINNQQMQQLQKTTNLTFETIKKALPHHWSKLIPVPGYYHRYFGQLEDTYGTILHARESAVTLSSMHQYKGKEADNIILINGMSGRTSEGYARNRSSEIRVFYVGVTRSRHNLTIIQDQNPLEEL